MKTTTFLDKLYLFNAILPREIKSRSKMVREGKLGVQSQNLENEMKDEEQKMTFALIYISLITTITALLKLLYYSLKCAFQVKNYRDKLKVAHGILDISSIEGYFLNTFNVSVVVIKEMARIAMVINASVNVFITFWSCKRFKEEIHKVADTWKKVLLQILSRPEAQGIEMSTF